jgi:hypothetical protein
LLFYNKGHFLAIHGWHQILVSIDRGITSSHERMGYACLRNKKGCENNVKECKPVC